MNLTIVQNVSQGMGCTLLAYGVSRYVKQLNLDRCSSINIHLGLTSIAVSGLSLVVRQLV